MYETKLQFTEQAGLPPAGLAPIIKCYSQRGSAKLVRKYGVTLTVVCSDSRRECSG